jgi:hypothetical protein
MVKISVRTSSAVSRDTARRGFAWGEHLLSLRGWLKDFETIVLLNFVFTDLLATALQAPPCSRTRKPPVAARLIITPRLEQDLCA